MLAAIDIRNIALIERLSLQFGSGLNVLSGETGAGKTIIIDSLNLALGGRADRELIRTGESEAEVRALFDLCGDEALIAAVKELGFECEDGQLLITRQLSESGRNICRIGSQLVTLTQLRQVAGMLVEMHGQHEHQTLTDPKQQLMYLDAYARRDIEADLAAVAAQYEVWRGLRNRLKRLKETAQDADRRTELLKFEQKEMEALKLKPGEDVRLQTRVDEMRAFERTGDALETANTALSSARGSAVDLMRRAANALERVADAGPVYEKLSARLNDLAYQVEDAAYEVGNLYAAQDLDPQQLERMEQRLSQLNIIKQRYGPSLDDVIARYEGIGSELDAIADAQRELKALTQQKKAEQSKLAELCGALTKRRAEAGRRFADEIKAQLSDLGMAKVEFNVAVEPHKQASAVSANGWDTVEFTMSANAGESARPLSKIASGGELSRTMLALKAVAADADAIGTMIFDEIDTGISGRITQAVGEKLARIAMRRQVIVITHQAPIAALADCQYLVEKYEQDGRAFTRVRPLDTEARINEISRIMGGSDEASLNHARSMLANADAVKSRIKAEERGNI